MSDILYFYPANETVYRKLLMRLSPLMDREGMEFHIARPGETDQPEPSGSVITDMERMKTL